MTMKATHENIPKKKSKKVITTITLPAELHARLKKRPDLNWSEIATLALLAELDGTPSVAVRIARLQLELDEVKAMIEATRKVLGS